MKHLRKLTAIFLAVAMLIWFASCAKNPSEKSAVTEKNGDIVILFTSDVRWGGDKGFGYAGLQQMRSALETQGFTAFNGATVIMEGYKLDNRALIDFI